MRTDYKEYLQHVNKTDDLSKYFVEYIGREDPASLQEFQTRISPTTPTLNTSSLPGINKTFLNSQVNSKPLTIDPVKETAVVEDMPTANPTVVSGQKFKSREEFVKTLLPMAKRIAQKYGIDENIIISQAALESGYGKNTLTAKANNIFSIQVPKNLQGKGRGLAHKDSDANKNLYNTEFEKDESLEANMERWAKMIFNPKSSYYKGSAQAAKISADEFVRAHASSPYAEGIGKTPEERYNYKYKLYKSTLDNIRKLREKNKL